MLTRIKQRIDADEGLTLIEMLVAFFIVAIVLTALTSTLMASLRSIVSSESRLRATQLANEVLEELQAWDWDDLENYEPDDPVTRANMTYNVTVVVDWVDVAAAAGTENYRQFDVEISWQEFAVSRSLSKTAVRAPLPEEEDAAIFGLREGTVDPNLGFIRIEDGKLAKDGAGNGVSRVDLRAVTTAPLDADSVSVTFENRYGETVGVSETVPLPL